MKKFFPLWVIPSLIVFSFVTVWLRLTLVQSTYELNQASQTLQNLKLEKERLELRVATLRSPRRLEQLARTQFGLKPPPPNRVIQMRTSTQPGVTR